MEEGWIKLHRKMRDWQWYTDIPVKTLFIHLLISANHTPKMWRGILVERGQFLTGRKVLSDETGLSEMQVRSALEKLKKSGEITSKTTNKFTMITICNYNDYQKKEGGANQQDNQQITNEQPTNNQQITTNKNEENEKNEEKKQPSPEIEGKLLKAIQEQEEFLRGKFPKLDFELTVQKFIAFSSGREPSVNPKLDLIKFFQNERQPEKDSSPEALPYFEGYY